VRLIHPRAKSPIALVVGSDRVLESSSDLGQKAWKRRTVMSRRPWSDRQTVEHCPCLSAVDMKRDGVFKAGPGRRWELQWAASSGHQPMTIGYSVVEHPGYAMALRIGDAPDWASSDGRHPLVLITTVRPRFGGRRFWLLCPLCRARVGRLYLPAGKSVFACRTCHWLTYESCKSHDSRKDFLAKHPHALLRCLGSDSMRRKLLGVDAFALMVKRARKRRRGWEILQEAADQIVGVVRDTE